MFHDPCAGARTAGMKSKICILQSQLFEVIYKIFYRPKTQNGCLLVLYIVTETHFRMLPKKLF